MKPNKNTINALGALSNDLYRVALLTHRGSWASVDKFWLESKARIEEIDKNTVQPYIQNILIQVENNTCPDQKEKDKAEDYLMYSIQIQNYVASLLSN